MKKQLEDVAEIETAAGEFYDALNTLFTGDASPMLALWSHTDDVTYLGPNGGILVGWEEVKTSWEKQAALNLGGKITPKDMHVFRNKDFGVVQSYEIGINYMNGKEERVQIRATKVYRKENGKWKLVSQHADIIPNLQNMLGQ